LVVYRYNTIISTKIHRFLVSAGLELQKRWKGLRDGYVKEVKNMKQIKSGSGASARSSYLYYGRLQFLQPTIKKKFD